MATDNVCFAAVLICRFLYVTGQTTCRHADCNTVQSAGSKVEIHSKDGTLHYSFTIL